MPVRSLGYTVVSATDLTAWKEFAVDLLGLQVAAEDPTRLLLRMDEKSYRLDIRKADEDRVASLGWEVSDQAELDRTADALEASGFVVKRSDRATARARLLSGLVSVEDPDGQRLELFYGLKTERTPFASPSGTRFVTGRGGLGHAFQFVAESESFEQFYLGALGFRLSDYIEFGPSQATFAHCNPRHHSFAWAAIPSAPVGIQHLMFEVADLDAVGRAWDKVQDGAAPIASTLGRHSNDEMLSFYIKSPSGFFVEYGFGGRLIDEATWTPTRYDAPSVLGHKQTDPSIPDV
jgi:2,3-dihydroxybiphenyl 1,2-dioxygenase